MTKCISPDQQVAFPMHRESVVELPWAFVEQWRAQIERNHGQTLERLAERGGLDESEIYSAAHGLTGTSDRNRSKRWLMLALRRWSAQTTADQSQPSAQA